MTLIAESAILTAEEFCTYLRIAPKNPSRLVARLVRQKKLRAIMPSRKQGWRIHQEAAKDCLMMKGTR